MSARREDRDDLVQTSLHLLLVLSNYHPPAEDRTVELVEMNTGFRAIVTSLQDLRKETVPPEVLSINEFSSLLAHIEGEANFKELHRGLAHLLANYVALNTTALPSTIKVFPLFRELVLAVLQLVHANPVLQSRVNRLAVSGLCDVARRSQRPALADAVHVRPKLVPCSRHATHLEPGLHFPGAVVS